MSLQKDVIDLLKSEGAWAVKVQVANFRGCPDILACVNGKFWGIEIKDGKDKLSAIQHEQLCMIIEAGGRAFVVANSEHLAFLGGQCLGFSQERSNGFAPRLMDYERFARELHYACID